MRPAARGARWSWLFVAFVAAACGLPRPLRVSPTLGMQEPSFLATIGAYTDARFLAGNRVEILLDGDGTFPPLLDAIRAAKRSVTFAQYFWDAGAIGEDVVHVLAERCRQGVHAHVLLDSFGASGIGRALVSELEEAGCQLEWFRRIKVVQFLTPWELLSYNNRSHRRIMVVDGTVGFTGGYGISEAWMGDGRQPDRWRDTNVRITGPIVQQLQAAFVQDWAATTGVALVGDDYFPRLTPQGDVLAQIVKSAPAAGTSESYMMFLLAITAARRKIHITNPYFVVDRPMCEALIDAAKRGVDVKILVPGRLEHDIVRVDQNLVHYAGRGSLGPLLKAGVRIYEYEAALLHAKTMIVDDLWATVGSTNLDRRSFELNEELNLTVFDARTASELNRVFDDDLAQSRELTYTQWRTRGIVQRFFELFAIPARSQL